MEINQKIGPDTTEDVGTLKKQAVMWERKGNNQKALETYENCLKIY
jgi:hypothetical protein